MIITPALNEGVRGFLEVERASALSRRHRDDAGYTISLRTDNLINSRCFRLGREFNPCPEILRSHALAAPTIPLSGQLGLNSRHGHGSPYGGTGRCRQAFGGQLGRKKPSASVGLDCGAG